MQYYLKASRAAGGWGVVGGFWRMKVRAQAHGRREGVENSIGSFAHNILPTISSTDSFNEESFVGGIRFCFIFYLIMLHNYTLH